MKEQTILHLMVKSSLLYVIRNRSYSHLKNVPVGENCQFWVIQTEKTKRIENKSLNGEFQRYIILFFISVLWLPVYQLNQKDTCINNENRYRETIIIIQLRVAYGTIP